MEKMIRVTARGIIVRDGHILLIACHKDGLGPHYAIPGGGVHYGEPFQEAVRRELREVTGLDVEVGRLLMTVEALHENATTPANEFHGIALLFECSIPANARPELPPTPDYTQVGVAWIPLEKLTRITLLPDIGAALQAVLRGDPDPPTFVRHTRIPGT